MLPIVYLVQIWYSQMVEYKRLPTLYMDPSACNAIEDENNG